MSIFVPNKVYLRGILLHYFIQKKSAAEAHRILVQTYGDNALSDTTCRDWFRRFKNNDFELEDKERSGAPKKFQDEELEQLLDEDPSQALSELGKILQVDESTVSKRLKGLGMIQKQGHWVPYELHGGSLSTHVAKPVRTYLETLKWEVLPHPLYSPDIAPSDFHLFHCKENESEKGSPKSARALETTSFAMKGRDKRDQWILFANESTVSTIRQEMARPRKDLRQTAKRPILCNFEHRFKQALVTTVKQISAGDE
ncbi:MOS1T transposase, partial [Pseudoatta argentina]